MQREDASSVSVPAADEDNKLLIGFINQVIPRGEN
jgi:hypothetical protein